MYFKQHYYKMKLYHFTTLESFTKIWVTKTLKFSVYQNLNDSFEVNKYIDSLFAPGESSDNFYQVLSKYKQISFALDSEEDGYKSPMMWGHYAHNENGVCIELDSEKLKIDGNIFLGKVEYDYNVPFIPFDNRMLLDEPEIDSYIKDYQKDIFFIKHKHWEHENEYRLISKSEELLSIDDAVTKIYVYNKSSVNTKVVKHLVRDEVEIRFLIASQQSDGRRIGSASLDVFEKFNEKKPIHCSDSEKLRDRYGNLFLKCKD